MPLGDEILQGLLARDQDRLTQIVPVEMQEIEGVVDEAVRPSGAQVGLKE